MVEGDATMASYVDAEGKPRQGLNISQRTSRRVVDVGYAC